jgi:methylmalonyl-CoA mutase N-terminal domain/subunit
MEAQARVYFRQIEEHGGVLPALEEGFFQREITEAAVRFQREVEARRRIIVGVNEFVSGEKGAVPILRMDAEGYGRQVARLREVRRGRDNRAVTRRLEELARGARREGENLMPLILAAVREYATLQEMMDVLREAWGVYEEPVVL